MFFDFLSKSKASTPTSVPENFSIAKMQQGEFTFFLRFNTAFHGNSIQKRYPYQVGIAIPLSPRDNGMPTPEENKRLQAIEEVCIQHLTKDGVALYVGTITGGSMKEFVLYTNDPEKVKKSFFELKPQVTDFELQLMIKQDAAWQTYLQFCPSR